MTPVVTYTLSVPPSLNNAFFNVRGRGRVKSSVYRYWLARTAWEIAAQRQGCCGGGFTVEIVLPRRTRGDIDNRCKGILDALTMGGAVRDDRDCRCLTIRRADVDQLVVTLR